MPRELALPAASSLPMPWRNPLKWLGAVWFALVIAFAHDWADMADQWWNSSTYTHVLLIPPIIVWLVWQRMPELSRLEPLGWWLPLVPFGFAAFLWLLGAFAGVNVVRQVAVVAMMACSLCALLGPRIGRALAFPLAYMVFLVPLGDELVPPLQLITARLTIWLIGVSGIPATIDGVFIRTPAGLFEVAEACSGMKFLVAMIAFGVLAAHVCFRSWGRRIGFLALCIVAPILANGVRAWGTIALAQRWGVEFAGGFDHIVYGWFFFAAVIALVIALGWRFFDRDPAAPLTDLAALEVSSILARLSAMAIEPARAGAVISAIAIAALGWATAADRLTAPLPRQMFLPEVVGWQRVDYHPATWWEPRASGADHRLLGRYADGHGRSVDVFLAVYSGQSEGREAGGFGEGALTPDSAWQWLAPGPAVRDARSDRLLSKSEVERLAETRYHTGNLLTGSNARLKLANIRDRLLLRARPTSLLILSAEKVGGNDPQTAIAAFRQSAGPLDRWIDRLVEVK